MRAWLAEAQRRSYEGTAGSENGGTGRAANNWGPAGCCTAVRTAGCVLLLLLLCIYTSMFYVCIYVYIEDRSIYTNTNTIYIEVRTVYSIL